jgi:radical SAM protein with 4Fe4S-binding SPASM domain
MEPELFTEVCRQYVAMGAGPLSLTPMVGDVLLDKELSHRLATLRLYRHAIQPSVTTNLYALDRHSDDTVLALLDTLVRLHISVYGITAEENAAITRRNHFGKFSSQAQRLAELWERSSKRCSVRVSFRNLYDYADDTLRRYVERHFGHPEWLQGGSSRYMNWGGSMSGSLPGDAAWVAEQRNQGTCILLATAMQVYWDGRVSACACCDYDAGQDLALGSVMDQTLTDIYNSAANQQIWAAQESGRMPSICRRCTFHVPIAQLAQRSPMGQGWFDFVGG